MKRITAASTSFAAATLVSATALLGGGGALASEPLRLSDAQMDVVTAGNGARVHTATITTFSTVVVGNERRTVKKTTSIINDKITTKREVTKKKIHSTGPWKSTPPDLEDVRERVEAVRNDIAEKRDLIMARVQQRLAEVRKLGSNE